MELEERSLFGLVVAGEGRLDGLVRVLLLTGPLGCQASGSRKA